MSPTVKSILTVIAVNLVLLTYLTYANAAAIVTMLSASLGIVVLIPVLFLLEYVLYRIFYKIYS